VTAWLDALAEHQERGEVELYEQGVQALARELGVPDLGLQVLSVEEAYSPPRIQHEIAPPARPDLAVTMTAHVGGASSGRRPVRYLLSGAVGAAWRPFGSGRGPDANREGGMKENEGSV